MNQKGYAPYLLQSLDLSTTLTPGVDVCRFVDLILVHSCCTSQLFVITQSLSLFIQDYLSGSLATPSPGYSSVHE